MSANNPIIKICGEENDTEAFFRGLYQRGGVEGVKSWLRENVKLPASVRECPPAASPADRLGVVWLLLQRVDNVGAGGEALLQFGEEPIGGRGFQYSSTNVLPEKSDDEGFGIIFAYKPE